MAGDIPLNIGSYTITREIGRGGMGVVYLGRDTRLDRDVAIKALPVELAEDADRLARFEREAKTLAQLNHPNIAGIYGLEEVDGQRYLILEYVEGETLADRLDRGALPVDDAVEIAVQIAAGVEAAHDAGVVHRDLKPGNVIVTPDGKAIVLDFGLARVEENSTSTGLPSEQDTLKSPAQHSPTIPGAIMGTAAYMSPEQARGRRVDKRSDIWSFGVVLYEMLTGASPFVGETVSDSIGAILHKSPDLDRLPPHTPPSVLRVLDRCLVRDKSQRYRDIGDVRIELAREDDVRSGQLAAKAEGIGSATIFGLMLAVAVITALLVWFGSRAALPEHDRVIRKFEIHAAGPDDGFNAASPRISPDGMKIAFIQGDSILVRDLSSFEVKTIAEAESVKHLAWSPDSNSIAFATASELFRLPVTGGAVLLGDMTTNFAIAWTDDDQILFGTDGRTDRPSVRSFSALGGSPKVVLEANEDEIIDFHAVAAIPESDVVLYVRHRLDQRTPIEAWDGERSVVIADFEDMYLTAPIWSPSGHVLFARGFGEMSIWAVPFSPERMEVTGDPFIVQNDASAPSVSANGTLSFVRGSPALSGELIWILPDGSIESIGDGGEIVASPIVSPDGSRIAFAGGSTPNELQVWVRDLERGINTRISALKGFVIPVAWSSDGTEIAVMNFDPANRDQQQQTRFLAADGTGPMREPYPGLLADFDTGWDRAVLCSDPRSGSMEISAIDLVENTVINEIATSRAGFLFVSLSPDGAYLLYDSSESGEPQVFCTRFPGGEGRWQVSSDGGSRSRWAPDGSAVYYMNKSDDLMRVEFTSEPSVRFGIPERVFPVKPEIGDFATITPAPDGERFVSVGGRDEEVMPEEQKILLIENWYEEFRTGAPR